jgi:tetratricopeptide (TPR) repeat protein
VSAEVQRIRQAVAELVGSLATKDGRAASLARAVVGLLRPDSPLRIVVAQALLGLGDIESSLRLLDELAQRGEGAAVERIAATHRFQYRTLLGRFREALDGVSQPSSSPALDARAGEVLLRRENPGAALRLLDRALRQAGPPSATLLMARADALVELGEFEAARAAIDEAIRASGDDQNYLAAGARMTLRMGWFQRAEELATQLQPGEAAAHEVLGHLALFRGQAELALAHAQSLFDLDEPLSAATLRGAALCLLGDDVGAEAALQACTAARDGWEARVWLGQILLRRHDYPGAIELFQSAAEMAPGFLLSAHLLRLGAAIASRPASQPRVGGFTAWGEVMDGLVQLDRAAAAVLASDEPEPIAALIEKALATFHGNRTLAPSFVRDGQLVALRFRPGPRYLARRLLNLIATSPEDEVLVGFDALLAAHGDYGVPRCYRAELLLWLGRYSEARADLEDVIRTFPETRWAYIGLATVEMLEGRLDAALEIVAVGIERKHGTMGPPAYAVRGEILRRAGLLTEAIADLEKACAVTPRRASAWINLALAYGASGRPADASRAFELVRQNAAPLLWDAFESRGLDIGSPEARTAGLESALMLMNGNRSSNGITWKLGALPLRFLFFEARSDGAGISEIQARELEASRLSLLRFITHRR